MKCGTENLITLLMTIAVMLAGAGTASAVFELESPVTVQDAGADLWVPGYSVPSMADWDSDGVPDLIVGEGSSAYPEGKVRIYRNIGTAEAPSFSGYVYATSGGQPLVCPASGCLGVFPRVVYWDGDGRKDLMIGDADGKIRIYHNVGTDTDPTFDTGAFVQAGLAPPITIDVGSRATPTMVDWNMDGRQDLLVGALDGKLRVYLDTAVTGPPVLDAALVIQENGADLVVPGGRSSPAMADCDFDGCRDLLVGNTNGNLLLYTNVGSDSAPSFSGFVAVTAGGETIDLPGTPRSRPSVCDWTCSGQVDVLIGSADGLVHLFEGPADISSVPPNLAAVPLAAFPNPFNPMVTIEFELAEPQSVELAVFSIDGRKVALLNRGLLGGGLQQFTWDGRDFSGRAMPTGQYLVHLSGTRADERRKITLLR